MMSLGAVFTQNGLIMEEGLKSIGNLDIGIKVTIGISSAFVAAAAIALPNGKEKEKAALDLFDRPMSKLSPQERKAAEFQAGHSRWKVRCTSECPLRSMPDPYLC